MKYVFASDIHGSALYCGKVMDAYEKENACKLILLGDLLYHGPRNPLPEGYDTKEVTRLLNAAKQEILCVRGNCDAEVDQMVLEFPIMADYMTLFEEGRMWFITHGHLYNTDALPPLNKGDLLIHGHTHLKLTVPFGNENVYINPGSASLPKDDDIHSYMTYENGVFTIKDLMNGADIKRFELA